MPVNSASSTPRPRCSPRADSPQTRVLIDGMAEASGMVIKCEDPSEVTPITDATIEWNDRLTS
jgi:hypothetical protein